MESVAPDAGRVRAQVRAARAGLGPWDTTPAQRLADIGRLCGAAEIAEILVILDGLSAERAALPAWDGDSADDIAKGQETYVTILGHAPAACLSAVATGLASPSPDTRRWVVLALEMLGPPALPHLRAAAGVEPDPNTRQFLAGAIRRLDAVATPS